MSMSSTAPAPAATPSSDLSQQDEKAIRRRARRRANFCPGAGWALLGHTRRGRFVLLCVLACQASIAWLILTLSTPSLWAAGISTVVAFAVWTAELLDIAWCRVRPHGQSALAIRSSFATAIIWCIGVIVVPLLTIVSFGVTETDLDSRMSPTIEPGERLVYHRGVADRNLKQGQVILYRLPPHVKGGTPGELVVARILAAPDDELTIRDDHYVVNGDVSRHQPPGAIRKAPVSVPAYPKKLIVPPARYFIVQDSLATGLDSQQLDYARRIDIVSTCLFHFGTHGLMRPVE